MGELATSQPQNPSISGFANTQTRPRRRPLSPGALVLALLDGDPTLSKLALSFLRRSSLAWNAHVPTLFSVACLAFAGGCDGGSSASPGARPGSAGAPASAGAGDGGSIEPVPLQLDFVPSGALTLAPKEARELTVQTLPPGEFRIRFALLDPTSDGSPRDAALDASEIVTNRDGLGHVTLTAPSTPTTFSVRASAGSAAQAKVSLSVGAAGYTRLRVMPSYSGKRAVAEWTATARRGVPCSKLSGTPPPDGTLLVKAAPPDPLYLQKVPVGVDLSITLRAGHFVSGCVDLNALGENDDNAVLVYASDRSLNLADTSLTLSFGPTDSRPDFDKLMKASATVAEAALLGEASSDVDSLLDAMHDVTPALEQAAFATARMQHDWDNALQTAFGKSAARRLRDPAQRWLSAGLLGFDTADALSGHLSALRNAALFQLLSVAQISPAIAGFSSNFQASWSADSSDTLLLGTDLRWVPSRLVTALASDPALQDVPGTSTLEAALADTVDCELVGKVLLVYGAAPGSSIHSSCDEACATSTCVGAVAALWQRARNASGSTVAELSVTATGTAQVGDQAEVTSLHGSWVGQLVIGAEAAPVSGALSAVSTP